MSELTDAKVKCPFDFSKKKISIYEAAYYDTGFCREDCPFFECYEDGVVHCFKVDIEKFNVHDMIMKADRIVEFSRELLHMYKIKRKRKEVNKNE